MTPTSEAGRVATAKSGRPVIRPARPEATRDGLGQDQDKRHEVFDIP